MNRFARPCVVILCACLLASTSHEVLAAAVISARGSGGAAAPVLIFPDSMNVDGNILVGGNAMNMSGNDGFPLSPAMAASDIGQVQAGDISKSAPAPAEIALAAGEEGKAVPPAKSNTAQSLAKAATFSQRISRVMKEEDLAEAVEKAYAEFKVRFDNAEKISSVVEVPAEMQEKIAAGVSGAARQEGVFGEDRLRHILGQDGVTPIPIQTREGRRFFLWTFGDTILNAEKVDTNATFGAGAIIPNSLAITQVPNDANYKNLKFQYLTENGKVAPFIKYLKGEDPSRLRFWANSGTQIGNTVYVYCMVIDIIKQQSQTTFKINSTALAKWNIPPGWNGDINKADFQRVPGFSIPQALVGDGMVRQGAYFYLLCRLPTAPDSLAYTDIGFARVKTGRVEDPAAYEYLAASGTWQKDNPIHFFKRSILGEASFSYDPRLRQHTIVRMNPNGQLTVITFDDFSRLLTGKYEERPVFQPEKKPGVVPYYSGKEIFRTANYLYAIYIDPSTYQPMLVKVPLPPPSGL